VTAAPPAVGVAAAGPIRVDARTVTFPVLNATTNAAPSNALSRDGQTLAVGAPAADDARVDVYTQQTDGWTQVSTLRSPALAAGAGFGAALAFSSDGRTLAVGAPGDLSGGADIGADPRVPGSVSSGAVSVYVQRRRDLASPGLHQAAQSTRCRGLRRQRGAQCGRPVARGRRAAGGQRRARHRR
jgi:hypothetical protein